MSKAQYVMKYPDGKWVQRDDSTGPMSTGGEAFPASDIWKATRWDTPEAALKYRATGGTRDSDWTLHQLKLESIPVDITPAMEAEARGDDEFKEYQRLAKKYGIKGVGECPYDQPWAGKCKRETEIGELFCETHKGLECYKCGAQATSGCAHAGQFVCGVGQCDLHKRHHG